MTNLAIPFFIKLHNFAYNKIGTYVVIKHGLHPKHNILNYHKFFVDNVSKNDIILDLGCGNGTNTYDVAKKAKEVFGIDLSAKNIEYAEEHFELPNLKFIKGDVLTCNFDQKFDKIILSNVLEHIDDRLTFLTKLKNISNVILLRVPMLDRDWLTVYKKDQGCEYKLDSTHFIEYTIQSLEEELDRAGWIVNKYSIQFGEFWGILHKKR